MNHALVDAVLRGVLGGRRKKAGSALKYLTGLRTGGAFAKGGAWLTAAGVAWGIYETLQQQAPHEQGRAPAPADVTAQGPLPAAGGRVDDEERVIHLAVSAARADGAMGEDERRAILAHVTGDAAATLERALGEQRPLGEILHGVHDPAGRATLYVLAYTIVRADELVSGAERIYLARVAQLLGLDPQTVQQLEKDTARRIEAQGHQG